jgi:hypothetical protein
MQSKEKLTTLCGFSRGEATLDVSNQRLGPGDAVLIANDISDMGALTSLNLAANKLGQLVLPEGWSGPDGDGEYEAPNGELLRQAPVGSKPGGIIVLANVIKDMGALTSLDISDNLIGAHFDDGNWVSTPEGSCVS